MSSGIGSGMDFLRDAAKAYFDAAYQNPPITIGGEIEPSLNWQPTLQVRVNEYLTLAVEASETPYPMIFNMRRVDLEQTAIPVAVYAVCPEQAYLDAQADAKRLMAHGYGLITVDVNGHAQKRASCIPIIQQIPEKLFAEEVKPLPKKIRQRVAESFERYNQNAPSGASDVSEVIEGLVLKAAKEAAKKGWITPASSKKPASALAAMSQAAQCKNALAAIGSAQGFISQWRNVSHHFPKNRKQAAKKYNECRHAFLDGLKQAVFFRTAMKNIGLSGNL